MAIHMPEWCAWYRRYCCTSPSRSPQWLRILELGLGHVPYCLEAKEGNECLGLLPLAFIRSILFGRFLVSLPYLNVGGVMASDPQVTSALIDRAVSLADELDVRYLELRHEAEITHPALSECFSNKVNMQLTLPGDPDELWARLKPKVRNQIRKGQQQQFEVLWGSLELLDDFHAVFSRNMRDLGTPSYGKELFRRIIEQFQGDAEFCSLRRAGRPVAAALLIHGHGISEVPSASSLREFNATNANMLMYWQLLRRASDRGQQVFDFGRSSVDSSTYRFKKQWGAQPKPTAWQYYVRKGRSSDIRPDNKKFDLMIRIWRRLPVTLTRIIGPPIVRGIP